MMSTEVLRATGIGKSFRRQPVLLDAEITVGRGEVVAIVGENGCGKTTLLRICAGLLAPDAGSVRVTGRTGYCPQEPGLFGQLTADEHLTLFGALDQGRSILAELGFPVGSRTVAGRLSGGQRQKLNLTLAVVGSPDLLLLDEPYQGFDHGTYVDFWAHVTRWRDDGRAVLVVTHLLADRQSVDRVVELPNQLTAAGSRS
ncbi:MAG TPA: ATP-binding cassette domain-containing protein [Nakamurella sp.]